MSANLPKSILCLRNYDIKKLPGDLAAGLTVGFYQAQPQPAQLMHQAEFEQHMGAENICPNFRAALERAIVVYL
ncbi:MAG TPA: hypothetical protein VMJ32_18995 [Pirellulales bacterium]|nr:hypothetical protein [Pirellulales bacterium]